MYYIIYMLYLHGVHMQTVYHEDTKFDSYFECQQTLDKQLPYLNRAIKDSEAYLGADKIVGYCSKEKPNDRQKQSIPNTF